MIGQGQRHWIIARAGAQVKPSQDGNRENVTIIDAINATGTKIMPPTVVFKGKYLMSEWYDGLNRHQAYFGVTEKGWTNNQLGLKWAQKFDEFSSTIGADGKQQPRLLLFDGHESHVSIEFLDYLKAKGVQLLCMPPHSTHILQPLDVGLFGPLQKYYTSNAAKILHTMDYKLQLSKSQFFEAFSAAHNSAFTKDNIQAAWKKSGYYPYSPAFITRQLRDPSPPTTQICPIMIQKTPYTLGEVIDVANVINKYDISPSVRYPINLLIKTAEQHATRCEILETQLKASQIAFREQKKRGSRQRLVSGQNGGHLVTAADIANMKEAANVRKLEEEAKKQQPKRRGRPPKQKPRWFLEAVVIDVPARHNTSTVRFVDTEEGNSRTNPFIVDDGDSDSISE